METEITLLRKLNHKNIVKYLESIRTDEHLHIVLELVDSGSLASILKKFGTFPESLAAIYTAQILRGLCYLHEQGVVHRDIKGANILTTKRGLVKLADFGVAVRLTENQKPNSVVGTPYWMAPEVIEMNSPTSTASDIWSVGCTVIEMLTGRPPYFNLAPMPALFRIVQDDMPPLPDFISSNLVDFLNECFQKDPFLRVDAPTLTGHPWIKMSRHTGMVIHYIYKIFKSVNQISIKNQYLNRLTKFQKKINI
eukprot:GHVL01005740.1.p1 GENE.GHVL01005740.1~~GHVL01005740.1.p1  ORF type:complete len:252 (+),score=43.82 GHVL01005740.1:219-974(+)